MRYGLDRTARAEQQSTAGVDRLGAAGRPGERPEAASDSPGSSIEAQRLPGGCESSLSGEEGQRLYRQVRDLEPDESGTGNRVNRVDTSAGPAIVRRGLDQPTVTTLRRWMPENTAIAHARASGVRAPRILYAGTDPSTGREFTVMQYVRGRTLGFADPEMMNWLPDLLDQVQLMSAHRLPAGMNLDIPQWQQEIIQHADDAHRDQPLRRSRMNQLGIGTLSDYIRPDLNRSGEPTVFGHNDLYPPNLRLDDQGNLWILDWETAGPSDPLYNAGNFLHRMGAGVDESTRAQATDMWLDRISPSPSVDAGSTLDMYRTADDWRLATIFSETMPRTSSTPESFEWWVDWYDTRISRQPDWPDISKDELRTVLRGWTE
ncbi:aminoglycoside phosphotransferase family protein [Nocardia sp. NPDC003963]